MTDNARGFHVPFSVVDCPDHDEVERDMLSLISRMSGVADRIVREHYSFILDQIRAGYKSGVLRDVLREESGFDIDRDIPGLTGSKSRYWRIISSHIFQAMSSRYERLACQRVITEGGHTSLTPALYEEFHDHGVYPTRGTVLNILRELAKGEIREYILPPVPLDYSYAGDQIVRSLARDGRTVTCEVQVGTKEWHTVAFTLPSHIDLARITKVSKPAFFVTSKNGELSMRYTVFSEPSEKTDGDGILGCDLGKIKPITCAAVYPDGSFTRELAPSRELDRLNGKIRRMDRNKGALFEKRTRVESLMTSNNDPVLRSKYDILDHEYHSVRSKQARMRDHLSRLSARDVVNHAIEQGCSDIHLEHLSWIGSGGGKWNFSNVQFAIEDAARHEGIRVSHVDAHGTSWEYPEEYAENPAPKSEYDESTRELRNGAGETVDKDYSAAVAIACRAKRKKALRKKARKNATRCRAVQPKRCRDKHAPTPQRPKRRLRTGYVPRRRENNYVKTTQSYHLPVGASMAVGEPQAQQVMSNSGGTGGSPPVSASH